MQVFNRFSIQPSSSSPLQFGADSDKRKLYTPISGYGQDQFTWSRPRLYSPITVPTPSIATPEIQPLNTIPANTKESSVTKAEFLDIDLKEAEERNLALTESFKRKVNIQSALDLVMRSGASLVALVLTKGWGAPLLPFINTISSKVSSWTANHIKDNALGRSIHSVTDFAKRRFNQFLSLFDSKEPKPVRFGGSGAQNKTASGAEQQLLGQLFNATDRFTEQLNNPQRPESKERMASQLFGSYFSAMQTFINSQGSTQSKAQMAKLAQLSTDIQAVSEAIPSNATVFNDIPAPARRQLFSVVYDALTLEMPEVTQWGESVARDLGISQSRINQIRQG